MMRRSMWAAALFSFLPLSLFVGPASQDAASRPVASAASDQQLAQEPGQEQLALELKRSTTPPFQTFCSVCHGETGEGDGPLASLLDPKPVDFTLGRPVISDRVGGLASDERRLRIIREGMPGSAMPAFHAYGPDMMRVAGLSIPRLAVTKRFQQLRQLELEAGRSVDAAALRKKAEAELGVGKDISVPSFDAFEFDTKRGQKTYQMACLACHGANGAGFDGMFVDAKGHSINSRDLRRGLYRGGTSAEAIFRRVRAGVPYSGMPAYSSEIIKDEDLMHLVGYVQSLLRQQFGGEGPVPWPGRQEAPAVFVGRAPELPRTIDDPAWEDAPRTVPTMSHFDRRSILTGRDLELRALHDQESIAIRVSWSDVPGPEPAQGFGDGIALQLSAQASPSYFLEARFRGKRFDGLGPAWFWSSRRGFFRAHPEYVPGQLRLLSGQRLLDDANTPKVQTKKVGGRYSVLFVRRLAIQGDYVPGGEVPISMLREMRVQLQCFDAQARRGLRGMAFSLWGRLLLDP